MTLTPVSTTSICRSSRAKPDFRKTIKYTRARTLNEGWDGTHDRLFPLNHELPCVAVCEDHKKLFRGESVTASARSAVPSQARFTVVRSVFMLCEDRERWL
jgi:hypothetical protein